MSTRPPTDVYFMRIAHEASTRATCPRRHVGCVLVRDGAIISTGYNGSIRRRPHCDDVGCLMIDNHCERTVHAEANAIDSAARLGAKTEGATAYVTAFPCWGCFKHLVNAGIVRIVYGSPYVDRVGDMVRPEAKALELPIDELLGIVPAAPAPGAGPEVQGVATSAPGVLRLGMTNNDIIEFDFGKICPGNADCTCSICEGIEALTCACSVPWIDHIQGVMEPKNGVPGCAGFSLASWAGGPPPPPKPIASIPLAPKRTRKRA